MIRSDNATSKMDKAWTDFCRTCCVKQQTTLPHSPWINFAERIIIVLGAIVRNCHRAFKIPYQFHNWTQCWCCDCHNIALSQRLDWQSPGIHSRHLKVSLSCLGTHLVFRERWENSSRHMAERSLDGFCTLKRRLLHSLHRNGKGWHRS
jgi:hypothetical protein